MPAISLKHQAHTTVTESGDASDRYRPRANRAAAKSLPGEEGQCHTIAPDGQKRRSWGGCEMVVRRQASDRSQDGSQADKLAHGAMREH
jgi:hypothetical protein